ncbi:MAG: alpha/beta fold hydrolase [Chloroflexota bacterium]|nr:alpha/beta fold hydrolase [Chloroflexota bacterium]
MTVHRIPGLVLTDHTFEVPLDHARPDGERISVFAREVVSPEKENAELPWLVFLQGGPGYGSPRLESASGWINRALQEYRLLLLDQRGTGRSTPVLLQTLARYPTPQAQAEYLTHFRADAIVQDTEHIRQQLLGPDQPWSVLGQSYGGFCVVHYLSSVPAGLRKAIITGGLPPLTAHPDEIYRHTYQRVLEKNQAYYMRYPGDVQLAKEIVQYISDHEVHLPTGDRLTPRRFQQLGIAFGASNGFEQVHYLLENAFISGASGRELSYPFLRGFENAFAFETNPIYAILHESIYCQGFASNWSAERILQEFPEYNIEAGNIVYFTGEMIYPWMFDEYSQLRPLKGAAEILADYNGWSQLYDIAALNNNQVPCVAAIYFNDMYVERRLSEQTSQHIKGIKTWVTNEYEHSGLRLHGEQVLDRLLKLLHGSV